VRVRVVGQHHGAALEVELARRRVLRHSKGKGEG
jgi:hypothetical protein